MSELMNSQRHTILVVDDSRVSQTHLVQILQEEYIVLTAGSGVEAIQTAKIAQPDIILMDVVMPQLDGYETLTKLKEFHQTRDIPVMFVTSLNQDNNEEKGLRLGAVDYIVKPYNATIVKLRVGLQIKLLQQMRTIQHLSMADPVTGMPNRRHFEQRLNEEWQRAAKEGRRLGLLMVDVDRLKKFTAAHGYRKVEEGILEIAKIVSNASTNPGDIVARWAYDGFAVLLMDADDAMCNTVGEKVRRAAEDLDISNVESTQFTLSVGAVSVSPSMAGGTPEDFVANADASLYLAKELGRNQVVVHS